MDIKIVSKEEIDAEKKKFFESEKNKTEKLIPVHINGLTSKFNLCLLEPINKNDKKIIMPYTFDMDERDAFNKAIIAFDKKLSEKDYRIDKVKYDTAYDSCPDPRVGYDIKIVHNDYQKGTWERIVDYWS